MNLSPHFTLEELTATSTGLPNEAGPTIRARLQRLALEVLEPLREAAGGVPIQVTSGYRSPAVNAAVDGSATSDHLTGRAADLVHPDRPRLWQAVLDLVDELTIDQAILYETTSHIHVGQDPESPRRELLVRVAAPSAWGGRRYVPWDEYASRPGDLVHQPADPGPQPADLAPPPASVAASISPAAPAALAAAGALAPSPVPGGREAGRAFARHMAQEAPLKLSPQTISAILTLAATAVAGGATLEEAADQVADIFDDALDFDEIIPGPAGAAIELVDRPVVRAVVLGIGRLIGEEGLRRRAERERKGLPRSMQLLRRQRKLVDAARAGAR